MLMHMNSTLMGSTYAMRVSEVKVGEKNALLHQGFGPVSAAVSGVCYCLYNCQWVYVPACISVGVCSCLYNCQWVYVFACIIVSGCMFLPA